MSDIIDLNERRNAAERPDPEFIHKDDFGREMFTFCLSYDLGDKQYGINLVAYDWDDAQAKVSAMRESLRLDGQLFTTRTTSAVSPKSMFIKRSRTRIGVISR